MKDKVVSSGYNPDISSSIRSDKDFSFSETTSQDNNLLDLIKDGNFILDDIVEIEDTISDEPEVLLN